MSDADHNDPLRRWLTDDLNTVFLVAASSLALLLTSRLWLHIYPSIDRQHADNAPSILSSFHIYPRRTASSTGQPQSLSVTESGLPAEQKDNKSTRSKERRRRGKDPFRDLLKGSKKSKALFKSIKTADHHPPSGGALEFESVPGNDTASSTSRSQSPEPAGDTSDPASRMSTESSGSDTTPNGDTSSASAVASSGDISDHTSPGACSQVNGIHSHPAPLDLMTATDSQANISSASTVTGHASKDSPSSPRVPAACADILQPRDCQADSTSGSCAKFVRARTRLRVLRIDPSTRSSPPSSTPPDSVASPLPSNLACPSLSAVSSTHSNDGVAPTTPTNFRGSTPPEDPDQGEQPLHENAASAQIQIASMRGALEAARLREEQLRTAAERASKERDELRWRWNEDAKAWRMRESELQAQTHHLMQQLQAYAVASFQVQQPSNQPTSGFSSPTSPHAHLSPHPQYHPLTSFPLPPAIQAQNSASAPAHVRALLASAPMLTSHPSGFAAHASGGLYQGTGLGMSPLSWSGLGLCVPDRDPRHGGRRTPDSSASGSSSRGRRRRRSAENVKSASDESSLGDWDGIEDESGEEQPWEEEEDIFKNNALADAILKRPESLRKLSGSVGRRSGTSRAPSSGRPVMHGVSKVGQGEAGMKIDALKDPALETFVPPLVDTLAVRTVTETLDRR